jgi:hypothetical protein
VAHITIGGLHRFHTSVVATVIVLVAVVVEVAAIIVVVVVYISIEDVPTTPTFQCPYMHTYFNGETIHCKYLCQHTPANVK